MVIDTSALVAVGRRCPGKRRFWRARYSCSTGRRAARDDRHYPISISGLTPRSSSTVLLTREARRYETYFSNLTIISP
jgi:hypothetical protein